MNKEVLDTVRHAITNDIGSTQDIPYELANTIANVYFRYFSLQHEMQLAAQNNRTFPESYVEKYGESALKIMKALSLDAIKFRTAYETVPKLVLGLRQIDRQQEPSKYNYVVNYCLDFLKYDINDCLNKSAIIRGVERILKKGKVKEIENLIDLCR